MISVQQDSIRTVKRGLELKAENERYEDALNRIHNWAQAYPHDVFSELNHYVWQRANRLLENGGVSLTAISASNMRHVIKGVSGIVAAALGK
jgi:hypothetical protein